MKKRILVVDDEPQVTHLLKLGLETLGHYKVEEVNDSTCAIEVARRFQPDLILLDLMMPHIDGSQLMADILASPLLRDTPVIFLTALVMKQEVREGSFVSGHRTYLPKPVDFDSLVRCIERHLSARSPIKVAMLVN